MIKHSLAIFLWLVGLSTGAAASCEKSEFESETYTVCEVSQDQDLRLFLENPSGGILGGFGAVNEQLASEDKELAFAMNAGMFHNDRQPVGLYIEKGEEKAQLQHGGGYGNFGLSPNGVFCIAEQGFQIYTSEAYEAAMPACRFATQSGPMLVINDALHPRLIPNGDSKHYRNGVGTSADGTRAIFAISDQRVNFHDFARFFRDHLGMPNALFFDGKISRLYAPEISRNDIGFPLGPIVGLVQDR
ncbi:phosphodiester glycosidase family protein [Falsihalocynthiibacter sp. SS001]|uniref:phosphodiester glycosidase family protein n=1 Tax=Falsihalocynthiibacter sp. SS001 TaxID=3349698 RepID=UPI0036D25B6D